MIVISNSFILHLSTDAKQIFVCIFAVCISSFVKCLFKIFAYLWVNSSLLNYKNIYIFQTQLFVKYICCLLVFLSNSCPPFYSLLCICLRLASSVVMLQAHSRVVWLCSHLYLFFFKLSPCLGYYRTLSNPNPMSHSTPGLPVHHQLPESTQTHGHRVGDAHPTVSFSAAPSPPTFNLSQHQSLFQWVSSLHQVAKVLEFQLQHQSFQWTLRTDFL